MKVLLIGTGPIQATELYDGLVKAGCRVFSVKDPISAMAWFRDNAADMLIMHWASQVSVAAELLQWTNVALHRKTELLYWTGAQLTAAICFRSVAGSVNELTGRSDLFEFAARINAILSRNLGDVSEDTEALSIGPYRIDYKHHRVLLNDENVSLTSTEFDIVALLFKNEGRILTRTVISSAVWGHSGSGSRTLDTHISRIRSKLSLNGENSVKLDALYARGYRLERQITATDHRQHGTAALHSSP